MGIQINTSSFSKGGCMQCKLHAMQVHAVKLDIILYVPMALVSSCLATTVFMGKLPRPVGDHSVVMGQQNSYST